MNTDQKLNELEQKFGVSKDKIQAIELNLLEELTSERMLTICSHGTSGCDQSRCGDNQTCKKMRYDNCYCVNN